jgi:hypothetical protein
MPGKPAPDNRARSAYAAPAVQVDPFALGQ